MVTDTNQPESVDFVLYWDLGDHEAARLRAVWAAFVPPDKDPEMEFGSVDEDPIASLELDVWDLSADLADEQRATVLLYGNRDAEQEAVYDMLVHEGVLPPGIGDPNAP